MKLKDQEEIKKIKDIQELDAQEIKKQIELEVKIKNQEFGFQKRRVIFHEQLKNISEKAIFKFNHPFSLGLEKYSFYFMNAIMFIFILRFL